MAISDSDLKKFCTELISSKKIHKSEIGKIFDDMINFVANNLDYKKLTDDEINSLYEICQYNILGRLEPITFKRTIQSNNLSHHHNQSHLNTIIILNTSCLTNNHIHGGGHSHGGGHIHSGGHSHGRSGNSGCDGEHKEAVLVILALFLMFSAIIAGMFTSYHMYLDTSQNIKEAYYNENRSRALLNLCAIVVILAACACVAATILYPSLLKYLASNMETEFAVLITFTLSLCAIPVAGCGLFKIADSAVDQITLSITKTNPKDPYKNFTMTEREMLALPETTDPLKVRAAITFIQLDMENKNNIFDEGKRQLIRNLRFGKADTLYDENNNPTYDCKKTERSYIPVIADAVLADSITPLADAVRDDNNQVTSNDKSYKHQNPFIIAREVKPVSVAHSSASPSAPPAPEDLIKKAI